MEVERILRKKAIVIGASIAGTLSARVLSDYFDQVIILERDSLRNGNIRKGTPQATHIHFLLSRGYQILRKLCPDIEEELLAQLEPLNREEKENILFVAAEHGMADVLDLLINTLESKHHSSLQQVFFHFPVQFYKKFVICLHP